MHNEKIMIEKNIELSAEFSRYVFEHPEIEEKIPADAEIILLPEFDKDLKEYNLKSQATSSTLIKWVTFFTIPKICGVASISTLAFILRKPKAINVLLAVSFLSIPLFICVTLIRFIMIEVRF